MSGDGTPKTVKELLSEEFNVGKVNGDKIDSKKVRKIKYSEYEWGEIGISELVETLGQTIKKDNFNKVLVFLCQLLAYTGNSQINISFNAPSASGKSYLALEIARFFPRSDVLELGYASPTSFFHTTSRHDKKKNGYVVDLERKILIFLDMPHALLLQHLRPLLSHDTKEIHLKITDKGKKGGIKTKDIYIRGFPAVIFCTATFKLDEQELTRFILLSPETNQEKIREAIFEKVKKETDKKVYYRKLKTNTLRQELIHRIKAIKKTQIKEIKLGNSEKLLQWFYERNKILKPRHTRDIQRVSSLTKAFALLNLWNRKPEGNSIVTNESDLENAFKIWDEISIAQDLGVSPYILNLYREMIVPLYEEKSKTGITRQELLKKHYEVYGRHIPDWQLRQDILPQMETSGLIKEEKDPSDKRIVLIYPLLPLTISGGKEEQKYSESEGGGGKKDIVEEAKTIFGVKN